MSLGEKVRFDDHIIPLTLLERVIRETDIPKYTIEEEYSELIIDILHGNGKIIFKNDDIYEGSVKFGVLDCDNARITFTQAGIIFEGEIRNNRITGNGSYTYTNSGSM